MASIVWLALAFASLPGPAQAACGPIEDLKAKVYGFRPSTLTEAARAATSKEMDAFWELVKSRKDGATCLRQLLMDEKGESFFLYDGASLLASLDRSDAAMAVIVDSVRRAPIAEVDAGAYVSLAIRLALAGTDVTPLALRFLDHPEEEEMTAPAHAMTVNRIYGALLLFGILPIDRADKALSDALESGRPRVQELAARVLAALMTESGLKALKHSSRVDAFSAASRAEIDGLRSLAGLKLPPGPPAFSREQVLEHLRLLPRTEAEYRAAQDRESKYAAELPATAAFEALLRHMADGPPFTSLAGHPRFIQSAAATLTAADLPALREWRRQSVRSLSDETLSDFMAFSVIVNGVIKRLGLFAEYRMR